MPQPPKKTAYWKPSDPRPHGIRPDVLPTDAQVRSLFGDDADAMEAQFSRDSLAYFAATVLRAPGSGGEMKYIVADHHLAWDHLLATSNRLCVECARDHGKTGWFSFAFPIWRAVFRPNSKGYLFSATLQQAKRILDDVKEEIESNPRLAWLIPKKKKLWSSTAIQLSNGVKIYARGYGTKVRGAHPDWIVLDDVLNDEDAYSELVRKKHIEYFYTAITNMVVPGGQIVCVGTPLHVTDLLGDLEANKAYTFRRFAAVSESGKILWPARYSGALLASRKVEIGSIRFAREFLCVPVHDDMSIFPGKLFVGPDVEMYDVTLGMSAKWWRAHHVTRFFVGVDFAISAEVAADDTWIFVLGLDDHGNHYIVDIQRYHGMSYAEQKSKVISAGKRYRPDLMYLEANQMQRIFGDEIIRETDLPITKFHTTGMGRSAKSQRKRVPTSNTTSQNKNSLEGGVPSVRLLLENRKVRIPKGDERTIALVDEWISQMKAFTFADGKLQGVGAHDDAVMAFWITCCAVRAAGADISDGDEGNGESVADVLAEMTAETAEEREEREEREVDGDGLGDAEELLSTQTAHGSDQGVRKRAHETAMGFLDMLASQLPTRAVRKTTAREEDDDDPDDGSTPDPLSLAARAAWGGHGPSGRRPPPLVRGSRPAAGELPEG